MSQDALEKMKDILPQIYEEKVLRLLKNDLQYQWSAIIKVESQNSPNL